MNLTMARMERLLKHAFVKPMQERWYSRHQHCFDLELSFTEAVRHFNERNVLYAYMHHYFHHRCPQRIKEHRAYFKVDQRGFGEDAFHAMWWLLLREFNPGTCLEIGVYRGQMISLWSLIAKLLGFHCDVHGISPFTAVADHVSAYRNDVDYLTDTLNSFDAFNLPRPTLIRSLSTDQASVEHVSGRRWDLIYIDGSHDYEVVLEDYRLCRNSLNPGGLLVLDDSSVGTVYRPPLFAFMGHPGPSRVAAEFAAKELTFVGAIGHNNVFMKPTSRD